MKQRGFSGEMMIKIADRCGDEPCARSGSQAQETQRQTRGEETQRKQGEHRETHRKTAEKWQKKKASILVLWQFAWTINGTGDRLLTNVHHRNMHIMTKWVKTSIRTSRPVWLVQKMPSLDCNATFKTRKRQRLLRTYQDVMKSKLKDNIQFSFISHCQWNCSVLAPVLFSKMLNSQLQKVYCSGKAIVIHGV